MATHSSVLAWRIPETGEPGGLPSMGLHRIKHDWSDLAAAAAVWSEAKSLSRVRLFATPRTMAYQAPLSMRFSRQECWSVLPSPSPGDLPDPGIEPRSPSLQADVLPSEPPGKQQYIYIFKVGNFPRYLKCVFLTLKYWLCYPSEISKN